MDDSSDDEVLILVSQELEKIKVPKKVAMMSELVTTMAEGDKDETEIPLPNVKAVILNKVMFRVCLFCLFVLFSSVSFSINCLKLSRVETFHRLSVI